MNFQNVLTSLAAAALLSASSIAMAQTSPPATGSGSGGSVDGRLAGSTNSNSMGEPVKATRAKPAKKLTKRNAMAGSGSAGTVEGRVAGSTNSNSKGEPSKAP